MRFMLRYLRARLLNERRWYVRYSDGTRSELLLRRTAMMYATIFVPAAVVYEDEE
jgi:hypothetical protein